MEEEGQEASLGFTHGAGGGRAGVECLTAGHALEVLQEQPEERQVELRYFCLMVLKKDREKNVGKSPGFQCSDKRKLLSQNT